MTAQTVKVKLFTLSTCPWCRKAKAFLDEKKVVYTYVDYDLADQVMQAHIQDEMQARGASAFPFATFDDDFIVGYNPEAYARLLGLGEGEPEV